MHIQSFISFIIILGFSSGNQKSICYRDLALEDSFAELAGCGARGLKLRALELAQSSCLDRQVKAENICRDRSLEGSTHAKISSLAQRSLRCRNDKSVQDVAQRWGRWWRSRHKRGNPFDARLDEAKFFDYARGRSTGTIAETKEIAELERALVDLYGLEDCELTTDQTSIFSGEPKDVMGVDPQLQVESGSVGASALAKARERHSRLFSFPVCRTKFSGESPIETLYGIAAYSHACPGKRYAQSFAERWNTWYRKNHPDGVLQTENTNDRLLEYVILRAQQGIDVTENDLIVERRLATEFEKLEHDMYEASARPSETDSLDEDDS